MTVKEKSKTWNNEVLIFKGLKRLDHNLIMKIMEVFLARS